MAKPERYEELRELIRRGKPLAGREGCVCERGIYGSVVLYSRVDNVGDIVSNVPGLDNRPCDCCGGPKQKGTLYCWPCYIALGSPRVCPAAPPRFPPWPGQRWPNEHAGWPRPLWDFEPDDYAPLEVRAALALEECADVGDLFRLED